MARKKAESGNNRPIGPLLQKNLFRLGFGDVTIRSAEIAKLVAEKTGKTLSRQRISALLNAVHVEDRTLEQLARGIGVKVSELLRDEPVEI